MAPFTDKHRLMYQAIRANALSVGHTLCSTKSDRRVTKIRTTQEGLIAVYLEGNEYPNTYSGKELVWIRQTFADGQTVQFATWTPAKGDHWETATYKTIHPVYGHEPYLLLANGGMLVLAHNDLKIHKAGHVIGNVQA